MNSTPIWKCPGQDRVETWDGGIAGAPSDSDGAMHGGIAIQVGLGHAWPRPRSGSDTPIPCLRDLQIQVKPNRT